MKFSRLKRESKLFWPGEVDISDGKLGSEGTVQFPTLAATQERAEKQQCAINEWHSLFNWCVYVGYHAAAKSKLESDHFQSVYYSEIDWKLVEAHLIGTLSQPSSYWPKHMKRQFNRANRS